MLTSAIQQDASWPAHKSTRLVRFTAKLLVILVIAALALWQLTDILVLLIGAILLSIGLCAAARLVRQEFSSSVQLGAVKRMPQLVRSFIKARFVAYLPTGEQVHRPIVAREVGVGSMLKAIVVVSFLMLAGAEAMAAPFDELFVRYEAQGSIYELAFAQLGQSRATRPEVRAYAATLVNDHEAYNGALRDLAGSKRIAMPSSMATNDKKRLDRLAGMRGVAFDSAFVREAVRINGEDIRAFRREASRTADPDIRSFVTRFLEVDEKHEAGARALSERNVGSSMPLIQPPRTGDTMPVIPPPGASAMPVIPAPTPAQK